MLGAAAELVALLGSPTLAAGLAEARTRGRRIPSALERNCKTLDGAAAFLRHPREAEAVVASLRRWLEDGAVPRAGLQVEDIEEVLGSDGKFEEAGPTHRLELGTQVVTDVLEPREAEGKLEQKSALRELLVEQERIKTVEHEAQDLAHMVEERRFKIAQLEKAMSEQHEIAFLADVPAFPVLHIFGEAQSCNIEQLQRDDDAQETNALLLSSTDDQGRQLNAVEAKESILNGQVSSTDECAQGTLGNPRSIVKNLGCPQHTFAKEKCNGDALSVQVRWGAARTPTTPSRRWAEDLCEDTMLAVVDVEEPHGKTAGLAAAALEGEEVDGDVLILKALQSLKDDEVEDPYDERRCSGGPRRLLILQRHFFQTACLDEKAVDLEELHRMLSELEQLRAAQRSALVSKARRARQTLRGR
ncbi:unnamed protein product [Prorocentrum cordatum]|uniref:Uncharacterized protein n=1 Tax=Prorocentrum cordatum TaxID=2364126 RepID=A0ABN9R1L1_9DINO|nr:unnamed protein product [Polarella glacialis]